MEPPDFSGSRSCTFRKDKERISLVQNSADYYLPIFFIHRSRKTIEIARYDSNKRVAPNIVFDNHYYFRRKRQTYDSVNEGLMVCNNDRLLVKCRGLIIDRSETQTGN